MTRPRVIIIGGGFGGTAAAKRLKHANVDVVVIDKTNHYVFQPLLYQVATGTLSPSDIAVPIRWLLRAQRNTRVVMAEVTRIDVERQRVELRDGAVEEYDYLIVAAGARHSYFAHGEWEKNAPGLKTLEDALVVREHFLLVFEEAEREPNETRQQALQTLVIVGGGPTGVELAGMMSTIARTTLPHDFRRTDPSKAHVMLLEAGPRLLPTMPAELGEQAKRDLEELGVDVRLGALVTSIDKEGARYEGVLPGVASELIPARSVFWAAGNAAASLGAQLGGPLDRVGRVQVLPDLSVPGKPNVFVIGDLATVPYKEGRQVPWVAPAALQQGRHAAVNVLRSVARQQRRPFKYVNKGDLATIGRHKAVADFGSFTVSGVLAWLLWLTVHIFYLAGFRNRLTVMLQWGWSYFTYQRGVRLIVTPQEQVAEARTVSR